jgi:L-threonylcarbamoyladenylate synthase
MNFENDIKSCISRLKSGGIILYPTDTVWGLGCDATNEEAVAKIFSIKKRIESKSMIMLVSSINEIQQYCNSTIQETESIIKDNTKPTTIIYQGAKKIARNLINQDGTIAIRIVKDEFCRQLIVEYGKPIVSTSSNISGRATPLNFKEIEEEIKKSVDYIVEYRQTDTKKNIPSAIIKINKDGTKEIIRV